jgi:hypothetical protein
MNHFRQVSAPIRPSAEFKVKEPAHKAPRDLTRAVGRRVIHDHDPYIATGLIG